MRKRINMPLTLPVMPLTAKELEKQRAKEQRAVENLRSKEMEQALIFKKHERLARAMLFLQVLKR